MREWYVIFPLAFLGLARPGRPLRITVYLVAPLLALYGAWHEYARSAVMVDLTRAFVWASALLFFAGSIWLLSGVERRGDRRRTSLSAETTCLVPERSDL